MIHVISGMLTLKGPFDLYDMCSVNAKWTVQSMCFLEFVPIDLLLRKLLDQQKALQSIVGLTW